MKNYSVTSLARIASVSERTLRYYDQIGLLKPNEKTANGSRFYGVQELYRLQQILFYRELGYALSEIKTILDDPGFDLETSLQNQRKAFLEKRERTGQLIAAIDKTIIRMNAKDQQLTDEELYEGLTSKQREEYRGEAIQKWGEEVTRAEDRLRQMSKAEINALKAEGDVIVRKMAAMTRLPANDTTVQKVVEEYHRHLNKWNETDKERFRCLGEMYVEDARFRATYDKYQKGLANWLRDAIRIYTA